MDRMIVVPHDGSARPYHSEGRSRIIEDGFVCVAGIYEDEVHLAVEWSVVEFPTIAEMLDDAWCRVKIATKLRTNQCLVKLAKASALEHSLGSEVKCVDD
jgi:hypothetical protein